MELLIAFYISRFYLPSAFLIVITYPDWVNFRLGSLVKNWVNSSTNLSNSFMYILQRIGLIIEPCGVPIIECLYYPNSKYPALRALTISITNRSSLILLLMRFINISWLKESKHLEMSPSMYHEATPNVVKICLRAVWQLLLDLKPLLLACRKG